MSPSPSRMDILVFGDQTAGQYPLLRKVCNRKDSPLLTSFLELAGVALRDEIQKLPRREREGIPDFLRISDLVEDYNNAKLKIPPIESVLVTIAQLAHFIGYANFFSLVAGECLFF